MDKIIANKYDLINKLEENKTKHIDEYNKALAAWQQRVVKELHEAYNKAVSGESFTTEFDLPKPRSYVKEYNRILTMLQYNIETNVELSAREVTQFVMDEWDWKFDFVNTTRLYHSG